MSPRKEIVIIGAGDSGCSIAYHLAKQGVASLEVLSPGAL